MHKIPFSICKIILLMSL